MAFLAEERFRQVPDPIRPVFLTEERSSALAHPIRPVVPRRGTSFPPSRGPDAAGRSLQRDCQRAAAPPQAGIVPRRGMRVVDIRHALPGEPPGRGGGTPAACLRPRARARGRREDLGRDRPVAGSECGPQRGDIAGRDLCEDRFAGADKAPAPRLPWLDRYRGRAPAARRGWPPPSGPRARGRGGDGRARPAWSALGRRGGRGANRRWRPRRCRAWRDAGDARVGRGPCRPDQHDVLGAGHGSDSGGERGDESRREGRGKVPGPTALADPDRIHIRRDDVMRREGDDRGRRAEWCRQDLDESIGRRRRGGQSRGETVREPGHRDRLTSTDPPAGTPRRSAACPRLTAMARWPSESS